MSVEFFKVPFYIESDGSKTHFLPGLLETRGYQVGKKGSEIWVLDYWDALAAVWAMPQPRFRRRNSAGNAGLITCKQDHFEDVSKTAIEAQLAERECRVALPGAVK